MEKEKINELITNAKSANSVIKEILDKYSDYKDSTALKNIKEEIHKRENYDE